MMKLLIECPGRSFFCIVFSFLIERERGMERSEKKREKKTIKKKQVSIYIDLDRKVG
jgi:hypothetical protein